MNERIRQLTQQIEDLKRRLPAHSIPPAMMADLDELEAQLAEEIAQQTKDKEEDEQ